MSETGTAASRPGGPTVDIDPVATGWADYVAAARQLDGVRRAAATAAGEQARSVAAAREELTAYGNGWPRSSRGCGTGAYRRSRWCRRPRRSPRRPGR